VTKGRTEFSPEHFVYSGHSHTPWTYGYLFVMPMAGRAFEDSDFADAFGHGSLSHIGKWITPHTLRYVWATWAFDVGLSEAELRSLAYAMGLTVETLRDMYERTTPEQKRAHIEHAIKERLFTNSDENLVPVEHLVRQAKRLSKGDRQRLVAALIEG
jgi:hypothetical protein